MCSIHAFLFASGLVFKQLTGTNFVRVTQPCVPITFMSEEVQKGLNEESILEDRESRLTLVRLFSVLLEVDMRNNPELYKNTGES